MDRIGKPRGLVRYASEQNIAQKLPFIFTGRMKAYTVVLSLLIGVLGVLLVIRSDFETTIFRTQGMIYVEREDGDIANLYQVKMINKTNEHLDVRFELLEPKGRIEIVGHSIDLDEQGIGEGRMFVIIDPDDLESMSQKIKIGVYSGDKMVNKVSTKFLGPAL